MTRRRGWIWAIAGLAAAGAGVWLLLTSEDGLGRGTDPGAEGKSGRAATVPANADATSRSIGGDPARRDAPRHATAVEFRVSVVDCDKKPVEGAVVLASGGAATELQSAETVVKGNLPITLQVFAPGYSGTVKWTVDRAPGAPFVVELAREVKFPVKVFREDGTPAGPLTGYLYFRSGNARGYARLDLDAKGESAPVAGPEGRAILGFASDALEGPAVEREVADGTLLSVAVRPRPSGTVRVRCQDHDLGPPTVSFPILPAEVSAGNALAPHAVRQASRRDGDWFLFEMVAAGDVAVVARDAAETKEARRVLALAPGATVDCVLD